MRRLLGIALISIFSSCPAMASSLLLNSGWIFESAKKTIAVNPESFLVQQLNGEECCSGKYKLKLVTKDVFSRLNKNEHNVLYIPGIGGVRKIWINNVEFLLKESNFTSSGLVLPFPEASSLPPEFYITIELFDEAPSYFMGFSRLGKAPVIGEFMEVTLERDRNNYYQNTVPFFNAITLFIFSVTFLLIYLVLNRRNSTYRNFSIALLTWALFYLFLSGYVRDLNFFLGSVLHFPFRTLASFGLFLLVSRSVISTDAQINAAFVGYLAAAIIEGIFGFFGMPIYQSLIFVVVSTFSFYPLLKFRLKLKEDVIGSSIGILGLLVTVTQIIDSIKLHQGLFGLDFELPYLNRITFFPLLLLSFGDAIIQFSGSFHQLRTHLFKAKSYARTILHSAKEGLSHDNVNYFLKVTSRICGFSRVSLAQRQEDGAYRVIKLYGSKFAAEGSLVNLEKGTDIRTAVEEGTVVFGSVQGISDGWKTSDFVAVPVPQEKNPQYLMLLSDPKKANLNSKDVLPYLSQISSAIWTNFERTKEQNLRVQTEKKFSSLVQKLDPSLYEFITNNIGKIADPEQMISSTRGIVFFDQKAYSTMTEDFDDVTMGRFARIVGEWVTNSSAKYGARISSFAGDAFLLETFSIGAESEDSIAERTLNLVWSLAQTMGELNQILLKEGFTPVTFRFGAHIGNVAAANLDFIQKGLSNSIGDTVNVAARLQSLAKAGSIYISGELEKYAIEKFVTTPVPKQYVKGRAKKIDIFSLIGKVEASVTNIKRTA